MKKFFMLIFAAVCFNLNLSTQEQYKPVLDNNIVKWSVIGDVIDLGASSFEYFAYGDTLINDVMYKKVYREYDFRDYEESNINWKNYESAFNWVYYFIRESEDASKLYIFDAWSNREYLISDLSLQVGDEFQVSYYSNTVSALIDSVYIENGLKYVRTDFEMILGYHYEKLTFIEGVGTNAGIAYPIDFLDAELNCFLNQTLFYKNENLEYPCGYQSHYNAVQTVFKENYKVLVHKGSIEILITDNSAVNISLYDLHGRLLYVTNDVSAHINIPTSSFQEGMYLLKITDKNTNQSNINKIIL
jgi:hypothetical protein